MSSPGSRISISDNDLDYISSTGSDRLPMPPNFDFLNAHESDQDTSVPEVLGLNDFSGGGMTIYYDNSADNTDGQLQSPVSEDLYHADTLLRHENFDEWVHQQRARLQQKEAKLRSLRPRNLETRATAYEKRRELREYRLRIIAADEVFMKIVRKGQRQTLTDQDEVMLRDSHARLQSARDQYGPLEEAYNILEDRLDREEYELKVLEERLSKYNFSSPEQHGNDWLSFHSSSEDAHSDYSEPFEDMNPLMERYLSRQGDSDLLREAHIDLFNEHARLQERQEIRQRLGKNLHPEDQETLANFASEEANILEELREIDADIEILRQACVQEGLIVDDEPIIYDPHIELDIGTLHENKDGFIDLSKADLSDAEYHRFPLLLEKPSDNKDQEDSKSLIAKFNIGDTGNRIARWLLHKLRSSCAEVELLARFSNHELAKSSNDDEATTVPVTDPDENNRWQEEVLGFWYIDSANLPPSAYKNESTTFTTFPVSPALIALPPSVSSSFSFSPALNTLPVSHSSSPSHSRSNSLLQLPSPILSPSLKPSHYTLPSPTDELFISAASGMEMGKGELVSEVGRWGPGSRTVDSAVAQKVQLIVRNVPASADGRFEEAKRFRDYVIWLRIKDLGKVLDIKRRRGRRAMSI